MERIRGFIKCCKHGINDAIKLYIENGFDPNVEEGAGLKAAIKKNKYETVELLLDYIDPDYDSLILFVLKSEETHFTKMVDIFLSRGASFSSSHLRYISYLFYPSGDKESYVKFIDKVMNESNFMDIVTPQILDRCFENFFINVYEGSIYHKYADCLYLFDHILNHIGQDALFKVLSRCDIRIEDYTKLLSLVDADGYGQIFNNRLDYRSLNFIVLENILTFGYKPDSETIYRLFTFLIIKVRPDIFKGLIRYLTFDSELADKCLQYAESVGADTDELKGILISFGAKSLMRS